MRENIQKIDSLLIEIFDDIELKDSERYEADKIIDSILSLYEVDQKKHNWWLISNVEKPTWWSKNKNKNKNNNTKKNLFILT